MSHSNAVAIDESDGIALFNLLTIDACQVFVLIVAKHSLRSTIRQGGNCDATMLATHIAVVSSNLDISLRGIALATNNILKKKFVIIFIYYLIYSSRIHFISLI